MVRTKVRCWKRPPLMPGWRKLSTQGSQVIVDGSGDRIPRDAPDAVIDAVRAVVERSRKKQLIAAARR